MRRPASKTKSRASAVRRAPVRKAAGWAVEEVSFLLDKIQVEENCERAWQAMTSPLPEHDLWTSVEEHILARPQEQSSPERRWKYFAK